MIRLLSTVFILFLFILTGCDNSGGSGAATNGTQSCSTLNSSDPDTDGEGLSDCYEVFIGTSPADVDSDGDGLSDYDEVVTKAFDPSINNFQFNPRIADVPEITVTLQNIPAISVSYTDSQSTSHTMGVTRTNESATTLTHSHTYEQSVGEEVSSTLGSSGGTSGFDVSSSTTYSVSQQETMSWTSTQSSENRNSRAVMQQATSESGVTNSNGNIEVLLKVQNRGYQTITLSNMTITALQVDPTDPAEVKLVTGMDYDTTAGAFPTFDIGPNGESNSLPFSAQIALGKTYDLLQDSRNLSIEPTTWNITDQDGRSYTHNLTNVHARSAQVVIDYAGAAGREIENHYVATVTDFGQNRISAATALSQIIKAEYTEGVSSPAYTGSNNGLLSVRNVASDDSVHGYWVAIHNYLDTDGITRLSKTYDSLKGAYSLNDIQLAKGEVLHLMYYEDKDDDGIGSREEFLHGTSDNNADSDNDGLSDYDEIRGGWDVPVTRTLTRKVYSDPTLKDIDNDALEDGDERLKGTNPNKKDTDNDGVLDTTDTTLTVEDMQETAFLPLASGEINDAGINGSVGVTGSYGHTTDRFGNANAALNITNDGDQIEVSGVFTAEPLHGASMVLWFKADPTLPANGWNLYQQRLDPADPNYNHSANQFFWMFPGGFTVFGDPGDRHSVFTNQNELFDTLSFADWHMIVIVGEEESVGGGMSKFTVYYDGQLYSSVSNNSPLVKFATGIWEFAGATVYNVNVTNYLGGLDDIRYFKRALDSEEVGLLYEARQ